MNKGIYNFPHGESSPLPYGFPKTENQENFYGFSPKVDFSKVPGLSLYLDPTKDVTLDTNKKVSSILDQSTQGITFSEASLRPSLLLKKNNYWGIDFTGGLKKLSAPSSTAKFKYLHNGSPFGVFSLLEIRTTMSTNYLSYLSSYLTGGAGVYGYLNGYTSTTNKTSQTFVSNNGSFPLNTSANNVIQLDVPALYQEVGYGYNVAGNDFEKWLNRKDTASGTANYSSTLGTGNSAIDMTIGFNGGSSLTTEFVLYLVLIYDWTGYKKEEVQRFRQKVQHMIFKQYYNLLT